MEEAERLKEPKLDRDGRKPIEHVLDGPRRTPMGWCYTSATELPERWWPSREAAILDWNTRRAIEPDAKS